jgi:hypothetical protein
MTKIYSSEGCADAMVADGYAATIEPEAWGQDMAVEIDRLRAENQSLREMAALSFQWMACHDKLLGFIQKDPDTMRKFLEWKDTRALPNPESTKQLASAFVAA